MSNTALDQSGWLKFTDPRPYVTVMGIAVGPCGRFPILYRGDKVRSAKNRWSLPSGLHEVGLTLEQQLANELREELNLELITGSAVPMFTYENILPGEPGAGGGWHWVIVVLGCRVQTLDAFVNSEPDKHPETDFVDLSAWSGQNAFFDKTFDPELFKSLRQHRSRVIETVAKLVSSHK